MAGDKDTPDDIAIPSVFLYRLEVSPSFFSISIFSAEAETILREINRIYKLGAKRKAVLRIASSVIKSSKICNH